jgi:hypothetical protein
MSTQVTFKDGDSVVCVRNRQVENHFKIGDTYIVSEFLELDPPLVGFYGDGLDDLLFAASRFVHAVTAVSPPSPVAKRDVYAYLVKSIEEYTNDQPVDEFDGGYFDALKDIMEDCFGVVPVNHVEFVAVGSLHA